MNYTPEEKAKWDKVILTLEENMNDPAQRMLFNTFIRPLKLYAATPSALYISGESAFHINHMKTRWGTMLYNAVPMVFGRNYELEYYPENQIAQVVAQLNKSSLNSKYTFGNFIVGPSNQFAFAASLAVAENPGDTYNPLFIYGGVGLGKTHLMNAIGNFLSSENPKLNVLLMTSEAMTNELIEGIAKKRTSELRTKLRNVDVLMVDDVQFLSRTKATQEEFFHTFNKLYDEKKQIIIASDRPPKELPEIEERLRSRFEWGLTVDIQKPDFETRMSILKEKALEENIDIPYDVMEYIAHSVNSNIRELEGCLTSLDAHAKLMNANIDLDMARTALAGRIGAQAAQPLTAQVIIEAVAKHYGLVPGEITGKKRSREIALPRQVAMYVCREMTGMSTTSIGQALGGRDHTTVMHGCEKIADTMKADFAFKKRVEEIISIIENQ